MYEKYGEIPRMKDVVKKSYRQFQYSLDNISTPILWVNVMARLRYVNDAACEILQYSKEELMNMRIYDIDLNHPKAEWFSFLTESKETGNLSITTSLRSKDAQEFPVEITIRCLELPDEFLYFITVKDISESRTIQQSITLSEERNRIIVNAISDLIFVYDENLRLNEYYTSDESLLYLPWGKMKDRRVEEFMPQEYVTKHYDTINMVKQTGETTSFEYELDVSGKSQWFQGTVMMHFDNQKIVVAIKEITEKKSFEIALEKSEERLRNLIEQLPLGLVIANLSEQIIMANQAMADILLLDKEDLVGSNLLNHIRPDSVDLMILQTNNRKIGKRATYTTEMVRSDGMGRSVRIFAAPNYSDSGNVIGSVGIFEDITEQKANEVIRARQGKEIDLYGSLIRHDLRNDLGLILNYIEAVQLLLKNPDDEVTSFLNSALASIERMEYLLEDFGRPQEMKEVDIVDYIRDIACDAQAAEKKLSINVEYAESIEPIRVIVGNLLALVFMNLFRNTAQHAGSNPSIEVIVSKCDHQIEIIVSDNGPGVPTEFQDKLFTRGVSSKNESGGLGLYLSRQIIESIGGTIVLVRDIQGATFKIQIPSQ